MIKLLDILKEIKVHPVPIGDNVIENRDIPYILDQLGYTIDDPTSPVIIYFMPEYEVWRMDINLSHVNSPYTNSYFMSFNLKDLILQTLKHFGNNPELSDPAMRYYEQAAESFPFRNAILYYVNLNIITKDLATI
jgi:hypothetical protein